MKRAIWEQNKSRAQRLENPNSISERKTLAAFRRPAIAHHADQQRAPEDPAHHQQTGSCLKHAPQPHASMELSRNSKITCRPTAYHADLADARTRDIFIDKEINPTISKHSESETFGNICLPISDAILASTISTCFDPVSAAAVLQNPSGRRGWIAFTLPFHLTGKVSPFSRGDGSRPIFFFL